MNTITFGTKNSYTDWGIILSSKEIGFPEPKIVSHEIDGMDGYIDLTEALTGKVQYKNRKLKFKFTLIGNNSGWDDMVSVIANYLHGKNMQIYPSFDPEFFYTGRCKIDTFSSDKNTSTIVISCECNPYKTNKITGERGL